MASTKKKTTRRRKDAIVGGPQIEDGRKHSARKKVPLFVWHTLGVKRTSFTKKQESAGGDARNMKEERQGRKKQSQKLREHPSTCPSPGKSRYLLFGKGKG